MNTRLLIELRVEVGVAQEIGAVSGGTRRTVPLAGGAFDGRLRGVVLPGGSADRNAFLWPAPRTSGCDRGSRPRRTRGSGSVLLSNHGPVRNGASHVRVSQSAGGRRHWRSTPCRTDLFDLRSALTCTSHRPIRR